jgi:hypothetical protein
LTLKAIGIATALITRLVFAVIGLANVLLLTSFAAELTEQQKRSSTKASNGTEKPVHLIIRSRADIKQTFAYSPYPVVPTELEGYAGSQVGGAGIYRLSVNPQGAVTQITILKGFAVTAVYDERFSNLKGNPVPALDKVMLQALGRWRAKPGPPRTVDIYWSFGTQPWLNYGKPNSAR